MTHDCEGMVDADDAAASRRSPSGPPSRPTSVGGEPMTNSPGGGMMTRVFPCRFTNQRRFPTGEPVANSPIDSLGVLPGAPIAERPGDRPVNPGVGIVGVEIEQARNRPLASGRRQLLLAELAQSEDHGPADRNIILPVQLSQDLVRIRTEGTEPVNEITASSRVGAMLEDWPHLLLAIEPQQRHGGIGLALRQSVLGLLGNQRPVPDRRGRAPADRLSGLTGRRLRDRDRAKTVRGQLGPTGGVAP